MTVQNAVNGVVLGAYGAINVMDHVTIRCSVYDFLFKFHKKYTAILTYPACIWRPHGDCCRSFSRKLLALENYSLWPIVWVSLRVPLCNRLSKRSTYDR